MCNIVGYPGQTENTYRFQVPPSRNSSGKEVLQIAVKRRETKSKGVKERYKHLNAEFQRIARRDKKDFLSDQCKDIITKNRYLKFMILVLSCEWEDAKILP